MEAILIIIYVFLCGYVAKISSNKDSNKLFVFILSIIFTPFLTGLIFYLMKKNKKGKKTQFNFDFAKDFKKLSKNKQPLLIIIFMGLLLVGAIGSVIVDKIQSIQINGQKTEFVNSAQKLFDSSDFEGAKEVIQEGLKLKPDDVELKSFLSKVSNVIVSTNFYRQGQDLISSENYFEAANILNKVTKDAPELKSKAEALKNEIRTKVYSKILDDNNKMLNSKEFDSAITNLDSFITIYGPSQETTDKRQEYLNLETEQSKQALSALNGKYDEFSDVTWYRSSSSPTYRNVNGFYIYFGIDSNNKTLPLRLVVQYASSEWLFIESATVNVDGANYSIYGTWERDNNSDIWEWIDEPLDNVELIQKIINSQSAKIRFDGQQYYDTREISSAQKRALKEVLLAHAG
jgi:outer membrane protein assembly factor BamD (BamD/ComL family)